MKRPLYQRLYFQVLMGIVIGVFLGHFFPAAGISLRPLGTAFINLIKMMVAPIIFCTIVVGIAKMGDLKEVGRVGLKSIVYFEIVSTLALIIGLLIVNVYQPGVGVNADPSTLDTAGLSSYTYKAQSLTTIEFLLNIIPQHVFAAFSEGNILQVLLFAVLFGVALSQFGDKGKLLIRILDQSSHALFGVIGLVMKLAPFGACGAMAYSIGQYGFGTLLPLGKLMIGVCATCFIFVTFVLGSILKVSGFSLWKFLAYIKEEIFIVLGTSSSETALPRMISKLENMGCAKPVVGLVIPTGYSFNLDGTSIYLTMAAVFIAQATNTELSLYQQLSLLGVLMLTSKGAAAVPGGGFVVLATTLSTIDTLPIAGLGLLLGVDMFLSAIRSVTNLIGNGVATVVISKWEKAIDMKKAYRVLDGETEEEADHPEEVSDHEMDDIIELEKLSKPMD
ncbi:MAG TPA: dicarboxylate/amino acid:cation symporter [Gammaproteobacteria bacterium]|nr:dicarboxylate/amino acid:cation symporter [Gammaproteobacteria bacterium]HRA43159.1 dicarboxylate/amino acid:cation symporter [Gammaproteobacteria bacterium]